MNPKSKVQDPKLGPQCLAKNEPAIEAGITKSVCAIENCQLKKEGRHERRRKEI